MSHKTMTLAFGSILLASLSAVTGCATDSAQDSSAPNAEETASAEQAVVFEAQYSERGTMSVSQSADGRLQLSVTGGIGQDDPSLVMRAMSQPTLVDTYKVLKGADAQVPAELEPLSRTYAKQFSETLARAKVFSPEAAPAQTVEEQAAGGDTKDFYSQACVDQHWSGYAHFYYRDSDYRNCPTGGGRCLVYPREYLLPEYLSIAWNETAMDAKHEVYGMPSLTPVTVSAWTYRSTYWVWANGGHPVQLSNTATSGALGVTVHEIQRIII